ncbi:raqprd family integrative conjugative element protein [Diaphorobacter sp. JS3050]|uniref:integrative conjugative element protein, RAQPRD family n=1 Tax=Diaphorobacter sp. JS3050 TaxID=2735554 RepID=UPI001557FC8C|nr:RAQPRD family integrative conjugative element protein [Diaphorobacter sp. JS3050]QJY33305.1 raqprd family integrative conjugative element protein [Diaphorobacter sp. JS3050]
MGQTNRRTSAWPSLAMLLVVLLPAVQPAIADDTPECEQLAALARQLDLIDRLAEHAGNTAPQARARYHFDYARLHADLRRVRAGLQDYLVPQRAQPRDPVPLAGDYVRRDRPDDEEPSP